MAYLAATLLVLLYTAPVRAPLLIAPVSGTPDGLPPPAVPGFVETRTAQGLALNLPTADDRCGTAPLPCTPTVDGRLRLIRPDDLGSGFVLDPPRRDVELNAEPPPGVSMPDDLGVTLLAGWHAYEPDPGQRWMADEGSLLLYSERPRQIFLTLNAAAMREGAGFGDKGRLLVRAGQQSTWADLVANRPARVRLELGRGFNRLDLRLEAGSLIPAEVISGNPDPRRLSIAVRAISFTDDEGAGQALR